MQAPHQEIYDVKKFIERLNHQSNSLVVVEGKRDVAALKNLGFSGHIVEFHSFGGLIKFADAVAKYKNLILLFDGDRKGRYLTAKTIEQQFFHIINFLMRCLHHFSMGI